MSVDNIEANAGNELSCYRKEKWFTCTETVRKGTTAGRIRNNRQIKSVSCRHNGKLIEITFQPNVQKTKTGSFKPQ